jgi:hypothetical protein
MHSSECVKINLYNSYSSMTFSASMTDTIRNYEVKLIITCESFTLYSFKNLDFSSSVNTSCFGFRACFVMFTSNSVIYNLKNTKLEVK